MKSIILVLALGVCCVTVLFPRLSWASDRVWARLAGGEAKKGEVPSALWGLRGSLRSNGKNQWSFLERDRYSTERRIFCRSQDGSTLFRWDGRGNWIESDPESLGYSACKRAEEELGTPEYYAAQKNEQQKAEDTAIAAQVEAQRAKDAEIQKEADRKTEAIRAANLAAWVAIVNRIYNYWTQWLRRGTTPTTSV